MRARRALPGRRGALPGSPGPAARAAVVRVLRARARTGSVEERQAIAAVLGEVGGPVALGEIVRLLDDRSDRVRRAALFAFDRQGGASARTLARLRRGLRDPAPRVRAAAAVLLGRRRDRASVPALIERLAAPGTWEKPSVAVALGRIGDGRALAPLLALARRPERWLRVCAVHALGEIGARGGRSTVRNGLRDPAWSVRGAAATALGSLGTRADVPRLRALLGDPHPWPRRGAVYALGRLGDRSVAPRLRAALADPVADVRVAACWALGELGDPRARRPLARLLEHAPLPGAGPEGRPPGAEDALPPTGAEGRLFESAVAALARLARTPADPEVDRLLDAAARRLGPEALGRPSRTSFPGASGPVPPPTLGELFASARAGRPGDGR